MRLLRNVADRTQEAGPVRAHVAAVEQDLAAGGLDQADQHLHGGRFAGAVGAQVAENLAGTNGEADAVHGGNPAVALGQIADLEHDSGFSSTTLCRNLQEDCVYWIAYAG